MRISDWSSDVCSSDLPVAQKGDEALTRQWHMDILHLGKAQIAALGDRAGRVRPGMATKRDRCGPIGGDRIGIKVRGETREAGLASVIASLLRPPDIAGERVPRLDRGVDRKSVGQGKSVSVRVDLCLRPLI